MKTFDRDAVVKELLWSGHEDWTGLWEAVWWIQTAYPEMRGEPARSKAQSLLTELLSEGMVYLSLFDEDTNQETRLPSDKALTILTKEASWEPPSSPKGQLRYVTTEKGAKPLFRGAEASS